MLVQVHIRFSVPDNLRLKRQSSQVYFFERCAGGPKSKAVWPTVQTFLSKKRTDDLNEVILRRLIDSHSLLIPKLKHTDYLRRLSIFNNYLSDIYQQVRLGPFTSTWERN